MLLKWKLSIKYEPKIIPSIFGAKNETSKMTEIEKRKVEYFIWSGKIKDFSFSIFNNKSKLFEQRENNIVVTKKNKSLFFLMIFLVV